MVLFGINSLCPQKAQPGLLFDWFTLQDHGERTFFKHFYSFFKSMSSSPIHNLPRQSRKTMRPQSFDLEECTDWPRKPIPGFHARKCPNFHLGARYSRSTPDWRDNLKPLLPSSALWSFKVTLFSQGRELSAVSEGRVEHRVSTHEPPSLETACALRLHRSCAIAITKPKPARTLSPNSGPLGESAKFPLFHVSLWGLHSVFSSPVGNWDHVHLVEANNFSPGHAFPLKLSHQKEQPRIPSTLVQFADRDPQCWGTERAGD